MGLLRAFVSVIICLLSLGTSFAQAKDCIKISYWNFAVQEIEIAKQMLTEVYEKVGLCTQFVEVPPLRSRQALIKNEVQANIWRTAEFIQTHKKHIYYLPEPLLHASVSVFYDSLQFQDFDLQKSLNGRAVGTVLGSYQGRKLIAKLGAKTVPLDGYERLYRVLIGKRISAGIMPSELFRSYKNKIGSNDDIREATLYQTNIYHIVGQSLRPQIPALNAALIEVKSEADFFTRIGSTN